MDRKALEGIKVIDFTWAAAGPLTMSYLAQSGATIVKVESKSRVDGSRTLAPNKDGIAGLNRSLTFTADNSSKLSMALNLKHPKGIDVLKRLISWADVVAENFRPGTMEKWGLGYDVLSAINPSIIMFRSSARGQTGPDSTVGETGITLQSISGFTYLTGWPDRNPSPPWGAYTDLTAPALGAAMLIAALGYRARTGKGQCIDLSQYEAGLYYLSTAILDYFTNGRVAARNGNASPTAAPHGAYRCAGDDRWCTISVFNEAEWETFCNVIDEPGLTADPRFSTLTNRKKNEDELNALIEKWTVRLPPEEVMALLQSRGISAGVVQTAEDIYNDPQIKARGVLKRLNHDELGPVYHRNIGFKLSKTPVEVGSPGPLFGQHTEYVCRNFLKMPDQEFIELFNDGVFE
jgi:benzylsuccinate CoA-transferase BbsF subunit